MRIINKKVNTALQSANSFLTPCKKKRFLDLVFYSILKFVFALILILYVEIWKPFLGWCHLKDFLSFFFALPLLFIRSSVVLFCVILTWCWFKKFLQGIVTAPILFALEEFPQLRAIVEDGFENPENVNTVS